MTGRCLQIAQYALIGEVSFELYMACLLPCLHHAWLEQLIDVLHALTLQCSYWRYDREIQEWVVSIEADNETLKADKEVVDADLQSQLTSKDQVIQDLKKDWATTQQDLKDADSARDTTLAEVTFLKPELDCVRAREAQAFASWLTLLKALKGQLNPTKVSFFMDRNLNDFPKAALANFAGHKFTELAGLPTAPTPGAATSSTTQPST
ncbi:hypothetical protein Salat_2688400 [Sesamum alatum]|uniref:Uncharacterized protein n=1 Tax=Sesamum alatum TaxID=300844 RepID=A0AAE1XPQ7_9LAMI|nr:hypothetical protein Salat_2688400 [Sesamum alatum]